MTTRPLRIPALLAAALVLAAGAAAAGTLEITGPAGVAVTVNGQEIGILPLDGPVGTQVGEYRIEASHPGFVDFEQTVYFFAELDVHRITVRLLPLSRKTAWSSSILYAGLGQFYLGHDTRGWIYATAETAGLLTALYGELQRSNHRSDFNAIQAEYDQTFNGDEARALRAQLEQAHADMEKAEDLRNTGLMVAVVAIGVSVVDALISFPDVETGPGLVPLQTGWRDEPQPGPDFASVHVGVRMEF